MERSFYKSFTVFSVSNALIVIDVAAAESTSLFADKGGLGGISSDFPRSLTKREP